MKRKTIARALLALGLCLALPVSALAEDMAQVNAAMPQITPPPERTVVLLIGEQECKDGDVESGRTF